MSRVRSPGRLKVTPKDGPASAVALVGFVVPEVHNDFYATICEALAQACTVAGLQLALSVSGDDPKQELRHVEALVQAGASGVLITPTPGLLHRTAALLEPLPVVQLIRSNPAVDKPWVGIDDRLGVGLATRHLLELGHRRIGFIGGHEALTTGRERLAAYQDALAAAGAPHDDTLIALGPPRISFGQDATLRLTQLAAPITGLVLGSSLLTQGALLAMQQRGLFAPDDLSLVGYSDPEWFRIWGPGLTTIALPAEDIARSAAQLLFRAIREGKDAAPRGGIFFQPQLVERGSVSPRPGYQWPSPEPLHI